MTDRLYNVLFLCTGNSARSVMAECAMNRWGMGKFKGYSAGSQPKGQIHPMTLRLLKQLNYDTSSLRSKSWDELAAPGATPLDFVFTVCDNAAAEVCPVFVGRAGEQPVRVHWGYPDPSNAEGGDDGRRRAFELTRQAIGYRMLQLLALPLDDMDRNALCDALAAIGRS